MEPLHNERERQEDRLQGSCGRDEGGQRLLEGGESRCKGAEVRHERVEASPRLGLLSPSASNILGISRYFSATSKAVFRLPMGSS